MNNEKILGIWDVLANGPPSAYNADRAMPPVPFPTLTFDKNGNITIGGRTFRYTTLGNVLSWGKETNNEAELPRYEFLTFQDFLILDSRPFNEGESIMFLQRSARAQKGLVRESTRGDRMSS